MVYIFLADGFEECEALIPIDILRRAGITIQTVGVTGKTVCGSHNIPIVCDKEISEVSFDDNLSGIILPGGIPGTPNLEKDSRVIDFIIKSNQKGLLVAAICAAPSILGHLGLLEGKQAICYPGFEKELTGATISKSTVATDSNIITAMGVGAAFDFGFSITEYLTKKSTQELRKAMIYNG